MMLEIVNPFRKGTMSVATVVNIYPYGFFAVRIERCDGMYEQSIEQRYRFILHTSSLQIFPVGYCQAHGIALSGPSAYMHNGTFSWHQFIFSWKCKMVPKRLFLSEVADNKFENGMELEMVDVLKPGDIYQGCVVGKAGSLLRLHYVGMEQSFDIWTHHRSPNIFPVGFCELCGIELKFSTSEETQLL
ncbi:hypothetical protein ACOME3_004681 [Neoechinorhynchus agilis]